MANLGSGNVLAVSIQDPGTADKHVWQVGWSPTISDSYTSPDGVPSGLTIDNNNKIVSSDIGADKIYQHAGWAPTISDSFTAPGPFSSGLDWKTNTIDLLSGDSNVDKIWWHVGLSPTISDSMTVPEASAEAANIAQCWDGTSLYIARAS